jgi:hypothetical protein
MRALLLTVRRGTGERVMIQGFRGVLGPNNVDILETREDLTRKSFSLTRAFDDNDILVIFRDMLVHPPFMSYVRSLLRESENHSTKVVVVDVADDSMIGRTIADRRIACYFKSEYLRRPHMRDLGEACLNFLAMRGKFREFLNPSGMIAAYKGDKLIPLPLSYLEEREFIPSAEKTHFVSYIANISESKNMLHRLSVLESWKRKIRTAELVGGFPKSHVRLGRSHRGGLPHGEYLLTLSRSDFSVADWGSRGYGTTRYWEVPYSGSVPLAEEPNTVIPNNLVQGKHVLYYRTLRDLKMLLSSAPDENDAKAMGRDARNFVMKYHSPQARATFILRTALRETEIGETST